MRFRSRVPSTVYTGLMTATFFAFLAIHLFRISSNHRAYWRFALAIAFLAWIFLGIRHLLSIFVNHIDLQPQALIISSNWTKRLIPYSYIRSVRIHLDEETGKPYLNQVELQCDDPIHFVKTYGVAPES